jgi:hypothetical protein
VHADLSVEGVRDENCIRLAQLHSRAVDFNKTGIPAQIPRELTVRNFPDFMDMGWGYPSNKANTLSFLLFSSRVMITIHHWHQSFADIGPALSQGLFG